MVRSVILAITLSVLSLAFPEDEPQEGPFIIAHRGASAYLPEHTLEATAMAHGLGADYIEQDLVLSKDGVPVILHDIHLDAVTDVAVRFPRRARDDGKHYTIDFTLAELKTLTLKERVKTETGEPVYPKRYSAADPEFHLATFEEALHLIGGLNASTGREAGIYPELKKPAWHREQGYDLSAAVLPLLEKFGYTEKSDKCFLQCFEFREVKRLREELGYEGRLIMLLGGGGEEEDLFRRSPEGLSEAAKYVDGIGPPISGIVSGESPAARRFTPLLANAREAGLAIHPYTARADDLPVWVESYAELLRVLFDEAKVEGLFSDFPGL